MAKAWAGKAEFLTIYIKEAHPEDGWQVPANETEGVCYMTPKTLEERLAIVNDFRERFDYAIPMVVDPMDDAAEKTFGAWPERLYVLHEGKIAFQGAQGPRGFDPEAVEAWLKANVASP